MTPLLLLLLAAPPAGDWRFVDEAARGGRSVVTFRTVELADAPTRPLHPDDTPPAGAKFGSVGIGPGGRHRLGIAWHAATGTLWLDADADGRFAPAERHTLADRPLEAKVTVPFGDGVEHPRTVLVRKRGDGVAWAVRGYTAGTVTVAGRRVAALLTDGDADGCFDGAGADRVWLDLDGDGTFDPLTEQFPLGTAIPAAGTAVLVRPRPDGLAAEVRERPTETGTLRVELARAAGAKVVEVTANYVSEYGELVVVRAEGAAVAVPVGRYRVDAVRLSLADPGGKVWHYTFASSGRAYGVDVKKGEATTHKPLAGLAAVVGFDAGAGVPPGGSVLVQPDVKAGGLYLVRCETGDRSGGVGREVTAELRLLDTGGGVVDRCDTGFH